MGKTAVLDSSIALLVCIVLFRESVVRIIIGLLTLTELFKLFMLTLDSREQRLTTQLVLVGKSRQVELVVLRKLPLELFGQLSNIRLTLLDLLFELRQLFSDRSCSHIITTILKF